MAVWAKGDLDWVMSYEGSAYSPPPKPREYVLPTLEDLDGEEEEESEGDSEGEEAA